MTNQIEIRGQKLELDTRVAVRADVIKVGSRVKLLKKEYSSHKILHGIIIGFEPFKELPTIIVAAVNLSYSEATVEFVYINEKTEDYQMVVALDDDKAALDKEEFLRIIDRKITAKQAEIKELEDRQKFFLDKFQTYWTPVDLNVAVPA
jgi:hypothetical protein